MTVLGIQLSQSIIEAIQGRMSEGPFTHSALANVIRPLCESMCLERRLSSGAHAEFFTEVADRFIRDGRRRGTVERRGDHYVTVEKQPE
jgi:hypothetical protein